MNTLPTISLNAFWKVAYSSTFDGWSRGFESLNSLKDWTLSGRQNLRGILFMCQFFLKPTDFCVRYVLHIEAAPSGLTFGFNGQTIPYKGTQPFVVDVTDVVKLEGNIITFELPADTEGRFGDVYLQQIPCE